MYEADSKTPVIEDLPHTEIIEQVERLDRDIKSAARNLGPREARWLVDQYYAIQDFRIQSANIVRAQEGEPNRCLTWIGGAFKTLESDLQRALGEFAKQYTVGLWMQSLTGIGPVISAGMLAHLDVRKCKTAGHFWRFAGLDSTMTWEKGQKRPWNAKLKCLCWKLGECFVKTCNHKSAFYGPLYAKRKLYEQERNAAGGNAERAALILTQKKWSKGTVSRNAYESGVLPDGHIHAQARRWAVKMFLSHLHSVMYQDYFGELPPVPYVFEKCPGDHRHFIDVPNWPISGGKSLRELLG